MDDGTIRSILDEIRGSKSIDEQETLGFGEPGCRPMVFSKDNFHEITCNPADSVDSVDSVDSADSGTRIVFIDGGNAELFSSPNFSIHFIRVFHTIYEANKRVSCSSDEFYVVSSAKNINNKVFYSAKLLRSQAQTLTDSFFNEKLLFDSLDKELCEGSSRFSVSKIPGIIRRLAELSTALLLTGNMNKKDMIILDGDLTARISDEFKLINALKSVAKEKDIFICALSKTSNLLTSNAGSAITLLNKLAPSGAWYYYPVTVHDSIPVKAYFVKLHPASDYIFKLETFDFDYDASKIFPLLADNSRDSVFLGYPYGLVEADRFARVSNKEKDYLKTVFMAKAGKDWESIESASKALDAHSVLDSIG